MILREVRKRAGDPTRAVITVPAYFDDSQRQATRDAGRIAGLDVLRIVNEPTAAALAYGLDRQEGGTVAVYDLGGGTFDCSILQIADGVFKVLSTNGDTYLGGDDFDRALMEVAAKEMGVDLASKKDPQLLQALRDQAERVKIALSASESAEFVLNNYRRTLTRTEFESLIAPMIDRSLAKCRNALRDAELRADQITEVVLVGGSTRIPNVRKRVGEFFGRTPHTELNPDEVVALGAALQADILTGGRRQMLLLDVVPLSLGIETLGGVVDKLVHRNTTVPARATTRYSTSAEGQTAILINIYQGERELTKDCKLLGTFKLAGIPPMPAGLPQVDVTFLVNENGMLTVSAKEQRSGQEASVTVQAAHGLSPDEVDRMVMESVEHAQEDFTTARFISLKNDAEQQLRAFDKNLAPRHDLVPAEQWQAIQMARTALDTAMAGTDLPALVKAGEAFNRLAQPLAEAVMNQVVKQTLSGKSKADLEAAKL
jgi:molecular chaperone DnaK (HSP70)